MNYSLLLKYIIIGDTGVGKSCLLLQYTDSRYRQKHQATIGVEFGAKQIKLQGNSLKLQVWDTAGQESFRAITRGYYRNAVGAIVVYDITCKESFTNISKWLQEARNNGPPGLSFILVGNKSDRQLEKISYEEGVSLAKQNEALFMESSAKTGINIEEIFNQLTEQVLKKVEGRVIDPNNHPGIKIGKEKYHSVFGEVIHTSKNDASMTLSKKSSKDRKKDGCCK